MKRTTWLALLLGSLSLAGCAGGYAYYASTPPPPVRVEVRGYAPGPGFVWIDGYWVSRGGSYSWAPGRWDRPPRGRSTWATGHWENRHGRYYYRDGHWR